MKRKRSDVSPSEMSSLSWSVDGMKKHMEDMNLWLGDLPPELLRMIFLWVHPRDLVKVVPLVCKFWNMQAHENILWMDHCANRGLDASTVPGGVTDWRRYYFTPKFTLQSKKQDRATVENNSITWKGQGTVVSSEELPTTGVVQWQVRVVKNDGASWVCFGIIEPKHVIGDGDWFPSYSFCTCCDGYPKGSPRWTGQARGQAQAGDVFTCTADMTEGKITIVGPRGVNMTRALPQAKYVLYFTLSTRNAELAIENPFYCSSKAPLAQETAGGPPIKKAKKAPLCIEWEKSVKRAEQQMMGKDDELWIGDLPPELLSMIMEWVPAKPLVRVVPLVCKFWNVSANNDMLWTKLCARRGLDASTVVGGVTDWRRYYFTPQFTLVSKTARSTVEKNVVTWKGQGTVVSSEELPTTGVLRWQVRVVLNTSSSWVCFGIMEPKHVRGDGDWMPSYSFCTCCDGYPKGLPRWNGVAEGEAEDGDVFFCSADMTKGTISIVGPRGVNMNRHLPAAKYVLYFTVATRHAVLAVENAFYSSSEDD